MISQLPGIYQIRNTANGKVYVGSAASLRRRWYEHRSHLQRGAHDNRYLQHAWNKHGAEAFAFEPLFICDKSMLLFYEQRALDTLTSDYNLTLTAGSSLGVKHTPETCARMSEARRGVKQSLETVTRRAASLRGQKRTEETKAQLRELAIGRACSEETKAKLRAVNLGKKLPADTRAKISASNKGKPCGPQGPLSAEHKAAISRGNLGKKFSATTIARMRVAAALRVQRQKDTIVAILATVGCQLRAGGVL